MLVIDNVFVFSCRFGSFSSPILAHYRDTTGDHIDGLKQKLTKDRFGVSEQRFDDGPGGSHDEEWKTPIIYFVLQLLNLRTSIRTLSAKRKFKLKLSSCIVSAAVLCTSA